MLKKQKGITLIALIITIIVMLILVGVTITVVLNGGLFNKAEEATAKTKIAQIQEALTIKKAEKVADNNGKEPTDYEITINNLDMPESLKKEYGSKLKISKNGYLYYDASVVTNKEEQDLFKAMGIEDHVETSTGTSANSYTFTLENLVDRGLLGTDGFCVATPEEFWPNTVSEELKNSTITRQIYENDILTYNMTCSDSKYINAFEAEDPSGPPNSYYIGIEDEKIVFYVVNELGNPVTSEIYADYADLTFTITMAE